MTSSTPPNRNEHGGAFRRGFTLVEMLIVVGIIVVLVGILMPALNRAHMRAIRSRMQMDVQTLVAAMEAYKADMRDYPHIDYNDAVLVSAGGPPGGVAPAASNPGAVVLCSALVGPGAINVDGYGSTGTGVSTTGVQAAPGFTLRPQGQVYGPYIDISNFKFIADPTMDRTKTNAAGNLESTLCLADRYNHPILYYRANVNASYRLSGAVSGMMNGSFVADIGPAGPTGGGTLPFYNYEDNPVAFRWPNEGDNANGLARMCMMLGDKDHDGFINAKSAADGLPENPTTTSPYLIWGAGPDELFGFDVSDSNSGVTGIGRLDAVFRNVGTSDDVTTFSF